MGLIDNDIPFSFPLEFVDHCNTTSDLNPLIEGFRTLIRGYGFSASACGAWDGLREQRAHRFFFNDWSVAWLQIYAEKDFFPADPFVEEARRSMTSFRWSEVEHQRPLATGCDRRSRYFSAP
ncbi:MAG: autoinducer binding domain-containing protein [Pseudomonadota bacterium]